MKRAADVRAAAREARRVKRRYLAPPREKVDGTYDACDPQLQEQRSAWLRRLEMSRGRSAAVARWRPGERRAQVLQPKGNDVAILGSFHAGTRYSVITTGGNDSIPGFLNIIKSGARIDAQQRIRIFRIRIRAWIQPCSHSSMEI